MEKKFISLEETKEFLGMSRQKVYDLINEGMPSYKLGGRRIFDREELIEWVKSHRNDKPKKKGGAKARARKKSQR